MTAQGILNQFSSENLRPSAVQVDVGPLGGNNILGTLTGGVRVDYGFVAPKVRVLLGLSYFHADLSSGARRRFADRLRSVVRDPTGDDTIDLGPITWSDVTADLDLQYMLPQEHAVTAYLGVGLGAHVRHGSGAAIDGTFVQDALNSVTAGLNAEAHPAPRLPGDPDVWIFIIAELLMFGAFFVVVLSAVVDIIYAVLDPRIRLSA